MFAFKLILSMALVNLISCDSKTGQVSTNCNYTFTGLNHVVVNVDQFCKVKPCIVKCCPEDEILAIAKVGTMCKKSNITTDYSKFYIHNNAKRIVRTNKTVKDYNLILRQRFDPNDTENCVEDPISTIQFYKNLYIFEDGTLKEQMPNYYELWPQRRGKLEYCIDTVEIKRRKGPVFESGYILLLEPTQNVTDNTDAMSNFSIYSLLVTCFFLVLVLLVYSLLPQLRRIAGMVLMAYVASLLVTFIIRILREIFVDEISFNHCRIISPILYFTILSSFFWLNIMSFDTWWTFRGARKQRDIHRRGETVKFLWYCLYAWGTPALMSTAYALIDHADLSHWPSFVKPHLESCTASKYETILYLYVPMFIIIVFNCILFIMTTYNIWIVDRKLKNFCNNTALKNNTNNRNRFRIYKTLSVIMGVNWILELFATFYDNTNNLALYISLDLYNSFIGVIIFFLFVFKKNVYIMLCDKFKIKRYGIRNQSSTNNSCTGSSKRPPREKTETTTTV